jgi:hypothetical protein
MATPADQRLLELLDKWLQSLELHARYSTLDDGSYWTVQPWPEHERPSRWIIDLGKQKIAALRSHIQERIDTGDTKFSDALELMTFLANLVGSEHIQRFIPVADARKERPIGRKAAADTDVTAEARAPIDSRPPADAATGTREMPKFLATKRTPQPTGTTQVARTERKNAVPPTLVKPAAKPAAKASKPAGKAASKGAAGASPAGDGPTDGERAQVIADAARLVQWGRKWFELPELIARMADRPSLPAVRRILKENKLDIDEKARGP